MMVGDSKRIFQIDVFFLSHRFASLMTGQEDVNQRLPDDLASGLMAVFTNELYL